MKIFDSIKRLFGLGLAPGPADAQPVTRAAALREAQGITIDPDDDQWRPLTGNANRDLSPLTQRRMLEIAVYLWRANLMAKQIIELPVAYLLAEGVEIAVKDQEAKAWLAAFWNDPINRMDLKLEKKVRELSLFGEQCWPTFVNQVSGHVRLGYLDPAVIATVVMDPDNPEQPIGVVTRRDQKGNTRRYRVIVNGDDAELFTQRTQAIRQSFTDGECFYFAVNGLSNGTRGASDLLASADWLDNYEQFLFGETERANFLRAWMWDVTLKGATPAEVQKRASEISAPRSGGVRVHNDAEEWEAAAPKLEGADMSDAARLFRNHLLGGNAIPEHWFGGGGDVNRAAAAEMGEPTFKIFSMRQRLWKAILEEVGTYVIRQRLKAAGTDLDPADEDYRVEAIFPEITTKDTTAYAAALQQVVVACITAIDSGLISEELAVQMIAAIAGRLGVEFDPAAELERARQEKSKRAEADVFTTPPPAAPPNQNAPAAV